MAIECCSSKVVTLLVGPDDVEMAVHTANLSKSPVLYKLTKPFSLEPSQGIIQLGENDLGCMGCVVRYFYKCEFEILCQSIVSQDLEAGGSDNHGRLWTYSYGKCGDLCAVL